jgi:hypothetical protein
MAVTRQQGHISVVLANRILEVLEDSGATEPEKYAALEVARAVVPVLPNASCSIERSEPALD